MGRSVYQKLSDLGLFTIQVYADTHTELYLASEVCIWGALGATAATHPGSEKPVILWGFSGP